MKFITVVNLILVAKMFAHTTPLFIIFYTVKKHKTEFREREREYNINYEIAVTHNERDINLSNGTSLLKY